MITRDVGDRVALRYNSLDSQGEPTNATVVLTVTDPTGATSTPAVTNSSLGVYDSYFDITIAGRWRWVWNVTGTVVDVQYGQVDAANPPPPMYVTLTEFKKIMRITDDVDDDDMTSKLVSAQQQVERDTGRRFWQDVQASPRIYMPRHELLLGVHDIATTTGLTVEVGSGNTWSMVDPNAYEFLSGDDLQPTVEGWPVEYIRRTYGAWWVGYQRARYYGLGRSQRVRVTAIWGWPSIPEGIKNATLLKAARLVRRKDSPEGIRGFSDFGVVRVLRYDPDYDNLIGPYVKSEM